jgi:hypothetical protein
MGQRRKPGVPRDNAADQQMRDQEVLRANRELAAYFKGRRTEREARSALKIIKAFVRERERRDAKNRAPLPGAVAAKTPKQAPTEKAGGDGRERLRRKVRRKHRSTPSHSTKGTATEPQALPRSSDSDQRIPD